WLPRVSSNDLKRETGCLQASSRSDQRVHIVTRLTSAWDRFSSLLQPFAVIIMVRRDGLLRIPTEPPFCVFDLIRHFRSPDSSLLTLPILCKLCDFLSNGS